MAIEIERKFLINPEAPLPESSCVLKIQQGYLSQSNGVSVRVRLCNSEGFLTIKGPSPEEKGLSARAEYEYAIPYEDAKELLSLCSASPIVKRRHHIHENGFLWEVDFFEEENEGLILIEVELPSLTTTVELPPWVGKEVTGHPQYFNSYLSEHPYHQWKNK